MLPWWIASEHSCHRMWRRLFSVHDRWPLSPVCIRGRVVPCTASFHFTVIKCSENHVQNHAVRLQFACWLSLNFFISKLFPSFSFPFRIQRYFHVSFFCFYRTNLFIFRFHSSLCFLFRLKDISTLFFFSVNRTNIVPFKTFSKFKFTSQIQRFCHFSFFLCQPNKLFFIWNFFQV